MFLVGVAIALTAMGGMALMLSIVGIYALLSFMVTRRTREIGIRVALGATSRQVLTIDHRRRPCIPGNRRRARHGAWYSVRPSCASVILISIPAPGFWMPATIFLTLAIAGGVGLLAARAPRAGDSAVRSTERRLGLRSLGLTLVATSVALRLRSSLPLRFPLRAQ